MRTTSGSRTAVARNNYCTLLRGEQRGGGREKRGREGEERPESTGSGVRKEMDGRALGGDGRKSEPTWIGSKFGIRMWYEGLRFLDTAHPPTLVR